MKSPRCRRRCRPNCCAWRRTDNFSASARTAKSTPTPASWPRATAILEEEVKAGRFREDLFYRLNVVELNVPPLRERREDILPLAAKFIAEFAKGRARFSATVSACLENYPWPGNVRELRNAMERAALLSRSELILPEHLPARVRDAGGTSATPEPVEMERLEEIERQAILQTLRQHKFNRTETAKALGISRRALIYKLQRMRGAGYQVE